MIAYKHFTEEQRLAIYKLSILKLQQPQTIGGSLGLCQVLRTSASLPALLNQSVLDDKYSPFPEVYECKPKYTYDRHWWFSRDSIGNDARIRVLLLAIAQLEKLQL